MVPRHHKRGDRDLSPACRLSRLILRADRAVRVCRSF
jgi:hypothetical protein